MNTIQDLFQQAQLAEAAYVNLTSAIGNQNTLKTALNIANTNTGGTFSPAQATAFVAEWSVADQYTATGIFGQTWTGTGFSATLFKNNHTGQYSFAIRGSTGINDFGTDANLIATDGVAVSQLVDMYNYWQRLTHLGVYQAATLTTQVTETAYLTILHASNMALYAITRANLLSQGFIVEGGTVYRAGFDLSTNVYTDNRQWGSNTLAGQTVSVDGHSLGGHLAMAFSRLFPSATNSVVAVNGLGFKVTDANVNNLFAQLGGAPGFNAGKMQNVYGIAGPEFAAMNNGALQQPGGWDGIYIEDGSLLSAQIGGHSASQMTDSLAVYNLFAQLDPTLNTATSGLATITNILKASSNIAANTLESAVSAFGKLFNAPGAVVGGNAFDANRDLLYKSLNDLQTALAPYNTGTAAQPNYNLTLRDLTAFNAAQIASVAQSNLAYRYALLNLNPFAVVGNDTIYTQHNINGELNLFDPATHTGSLTDQYLKDRAAFLADKIIANTQDNLGNGMGYVDYVERSEAANDERIRKAA